MQNEEDFKITKWDTSTLVAVAVTGFLVLSMLGTVVWVILI